MKNFNRTLLFLLSVSLIIVSCNSSAVVYTDASPTSTPEQETREAGSTPTVTPIPTLPKTPTSTPEAIPTQVEDPFGEKRVTIPGGGFSIKRPASGKFEYYYDKVVVSDESDGLIIQIAGVPFYTLDPQHEKVVDEYLEALTRSTKGNLVKENEVRILVDEYSGYSYDVTGEMFSSPITGKAFIVFPNEGQYVFGFGSMMVDHPEKSWDDIGGPVFNELIQSLKIVDTSKLPDCTTSTDLTYGFTKENPVKVGGKIFWGPSREATYFENLLGPNGEYLDYERVGSIDFDGIVLDTFEITGIDKTVLIYIDEYSYAELYAPAGFSCKGPFLLEKP